MGLKGGRMIMERVSGASPSKIVRESMAPKDDKQTNRTEQIDKQDKSASNADLAVAIDEVFREFGSYETRVHYIKRKLDEMPAGSNTKLVVAINAIADWCEAYKKNMEDKIKPA